MPLPPPCNRFAVNLSLTLLPHRRPNDVLMGRVAMTVLRLRKAAEETGAGESTMWRAIESGGMSTVDRRRRRPKCLVTPARGAWNDCSQRSGGEARGRRRRHLNHSGAPRRSQDQPRRAASDLGRPQAGSRRVARAGRAAYRKAMVAAPRRLKSDFVDRPAAMRRK